MKTIITNKSIRYKMEDLLYRQNGILDSVDMDEILLGNENYKGILNSFQWFTDSIYISKINELLNNFNSSFSLVEFDWNENTGGLWVFKHH